MVVHLINRLPSPVIANNTPHTLLFQQPPTYNHIRVCGCLCYPNTSATAAHKLSPRSSPCVFLGFSHTHKVYRCLSLSAHKVIFVMLLLTKIYFLSLNYHIPPITITFLSLHFLTQISLPSAPPRPPPTNTPSSPLNPSSTPSNFIP